MYWVYVLKGKFFVYKKDPNITKKYICKSGAGFTIIELIISIFVLSVAVVGIFSAFSIMVILTSDAADRLSGSYLAQEGMEIVRNIRDNNWLCMDNPTNQNCTPNPAWIDGLSNCSGSNGGCQVDYKTTSSTVVQSPIDGNYLYLDSNGFYDYDNTGKQTKFKRKIMITTNADDPSLPPYVARVYVQVSWDEKANIVNQGQIGNQGKLAKDCIIGSNCIATEEYFYDWYNYNKS